MVAFQVGEIFKILGPVLFGILSLLCRFVIGRRDRRYYMKLVRKLLKMMNSWAWVKFLHLASIEEMLKVRNKLAELIVRISQEVKVRQMEVSDCDRKSSGVLESARDETQ